MGKLKHNFNCLVCGKLTLTHWSGKKYCSNACRQKAYRSGIADNTTLLRNTVTELHNIIEEPEVELSIKVKQTLDRFKCAECGKIDAEVKSCYALSDYGRYCADCIEFHNNMNREYYAKGGKIDKNGTWVFPNNPNNEVK